MRVLNEKRCKSYVLQPGLGLQRPPLHRFALTVTQIQDLPRKCAYYIETVTKQKTNKKVLSFNCSGIVNMYHPNFRELGKPNSFLCISSLHLYGDTNPFFLNIFFADKFVIIVYSFNSK